MLSSGKTKIISEEFKDLLTNADARSAFLRDELEKLTGKKPGGRSTVETLEKQYTELSEG